MSRRQFALLCCIASALGLATGAWAQDSSRVVNIPQLTKDLFVHPQFTQASLSPDGTLLGVLVPREPRVVLEIMDLKKSSAWVLASFDNADVTGFRWINNHRLVVFVSDLQRGSGESCWCGFYAVNVDGAHLRSFGVLGKPMRYAGSYEDSSDDVLVTTREYDESVDAFRVNTLTGGMKSLVYGVPHRATRLTFDHQLRLRALVVDSSDAKRAAMWYRPSIDAPWTVLGDFDITRPGFTPVAFSADNQTLYVTAQDDAGEDALFAYDAEQHKLGDKLFARRGFDVNGGLIFARGSHELLGIQIEAERPEFIWFDQDMARVQASVDAALPETLNMLSGDPSGTLLVFAYSDVDPGRYFLYDTKAHRLEQILRTRPWIKPEQMSPIRSIRYPARDGLTIPAYLTLPKGKPDAKLPLVVLIHGGPYLRDHWGFNPQVQFLAALGYAVLQPNYRGSTGFGSKHFQAGWRTWGLAMQDDITDGIDYLVSQGLVDRQRVCIMGASYGGYATLMGMVKEPDLFRCGVDVSGPSDIELEFTAWSDFSDSIWQRYSMRQLVGDPDTMRDQLRQTSPFRQAGRIKAPVLLVHGEKDWRVPITHAKRMRDALQEHHAAYEWLELPGEGHGFLKWDNLTRFYDAVANFLRKYNPPD
jgi:dipeptidyl aminopeptidase/acylaminoacyl peptidase